MLLRQRKGKKNPLRKLLSDITDFIPYNKIDISP